jgi:DNA-binding NarL/FixJ family response regulator
MLSTMRPLGLAMALSPFPQGRPGATDLSNTATILVLLGNALMAQGLSQFLECHGYRCWAGERQAEPHAIIVDSATIGKASSLGYPRAKVLFLQMEQDVSQVNALLSWHKADAIIPQSAGLEGFKKVLQAVGERPRAWSRALAGTEVPVPFTEMEKKVVVRICRGDNTREIAQGLHISPHTVKAHVHNILAKIGAPNRASLISLIGACLGEDHEQRSS